MNSSAAFPTLAARLWPVAGGNSLVRNAALILGGTLLLALSAHVQVPFWPVKMSMQTFVVLALSIAYGSRLGAATIIAYIAEGALGLPVFQSGAGLAYLAGPTGGFLLGFVLAAYALGAMTERGYMRSLPLALAAVLIAEALIYAPGLAWLAVLFGAEKSLQFGLIPFIPAEALKIALAVAMAPLVTRATR